MNLRLGWLGVAVALAFVGQVAWGQDDAASAKAFRLASEAGTPHDWTHSHVIFSAASGDRELESSLRRNARYWLQLLHRRGSQEEGSAEALDAGKIEATRAARQPARLQTWRDANPGPSEDLVDAVSPVSGSGSFDHKTQALERDWTQTFQTGGVSYPVTSPTYPAKFSFAGSPDCMADYVVFTLATSGAATPQNFNIIAYNNLYVSTAGGASFCAGTGPHAIFEYNASTAGGALNGSPVLSLDGTVIAFVEGAAAVSGGAVFHLLKWHSGDAQSTDVGFPKAFNAAALANCATNGAVAPCEYSLQYTPSGSRNTASLASPFIDYDTDTAYVSDDGGNVYAISPAFNATPANPPVVKSGWPVNVGSAVILTPPVYDSISRNVFVSASGGTEFFIRTSSASAGSCLSGAAPCLGSSSFSFNGGGSIQEASVVDSTTGKVFLSGTQTGMTSGSYVVQTDTVLSAGSVQAAQIGAGTLNAVRPGSPDNKYFTSVGTGKFYACGQNASGEAQLYAYGFNLAGVMSTGFGSGPLALGNSSTISSPCSGAMTEAFNQSVSTDWLFVGVKSRCAGSVGGTNGCVTSFDVTTAFPSTMTHLAEVGGATGIIVDNVTDVSTTMITTDIYFLFVGPQSCSDYNGSAHSGTCAASATQSALQ